MNCSIFRETLWTALDEGRASLLGAHGHPHGCSSCREYAAAAVKLHGLLSEAFAPVIVPSISEKVSACLSRPVRNHEESAWETAAAMLCVAPLAIGLCRYLGFDAVGTLEGFGSSFSSYPLYGLHAGKDWLNILSGLPLPWLAPLLALAGALWISTHHAVISDSEGGV
mgnify:FL=1